MYLLDICWSCSTAAPREQVESWSLLQEETLGNDGIISKQKPISLGYQTACSLALGFLMHSTTTATSSSVTDFFFADSLILGHIYFLRFLCTHFFVEIWFLLFFVVVVLYAFLILIICELLCISFIKFFTETSAVLKYQLQDILKLTKRLQNSMRFCSGSW